MMKKTIIAVGFLAAAFVLFFIFKNVSLAPIVQDEKPNVENQIMKTEINPTLPDITLPLSGAPKDVAWNLFQKYLSYNKSQNLEGVKSVVYKVASVCNDPKTLIDCKARMGSAYSYGSAFKKEDFKNVWSDQNQIILATGFWTESSTDLDQYGRFRSVIFFVKGSDQGWKLLSFSPTQGGATGKGAASQEEVDARLLRYTEDGDQDGVSDYVEECLSAKTKDSCVPTDPKLRDTDGDGFWDGVQALMK